MLDAKLGLGWHKFNKMTEAGEILSLVRHISAKCDEIDQRLSEIEAENGIKHKRVRHGDISSLQN